MRKLGIIGGGQLGQMIAEVAKKDNYYVVVLDTNLNCPASFTADEVILGNLDSLEDITKLCESVDIVTYEFENIPFEIIKQLENKYCIPQGHKPLMYSQNRITEKDYANSCGALVGKYKHIKNFNDLLLAVEDIKYPAMLKTSTMGYDGKGQILISSPKDLTEAKQLVNKSECILEAFIDYEYEISICIARSNMGEHIKVYPVPKENIHKNKILYKVDASDYIVSDITKKASNIALDIMNRDNLIGVMVFEFFVKGSDVYFNEMAPRPHNSYHYGIDATNSCQFGGLIKAIEGTKIEKENEIVKPSVMFNILGENLEGLKKYLQKVNIDINKDFYINKFNSKNPRVKIRLYGKVESKIGRKMGHITFVNNDVDKLLEDVKKYESR